MRPQDIIHTLTYHEPSLLGKNKHREYGILIPLFQKDNQVHVLFEVRSLSMRDQPGDVCLPGGRMDEEDVDARACALRETCEELGVDYADINQVSKIGHMVSQERTNHLFAGFISESSTFKPNPDEVDHVFSVPMEYFMTTTPDQYQVAFKAVPEKNFPFELIQGGQNYNWNAHTVNELFYQYDNRVIWGLTADLINRFVHILKEN